MPEIFHLLDLQTNKLHVFLKHLQFKGVQKGVQAIYFKVLTLKIF